MKFSPTRVTNLIRAENGTYYARVVHGGKQHWRTLKTKVLSVARQRLRRFEEDVRGRKQSRPGVEMTWGQAADAYASRVEAAADLASGTKKFRLLSRATLRRVAPHLEALDVRRVKTDELAAILNRLAGFIPPGAKTPAKASATTHNRVLAYMRNVLAVAIEAGLLGSNPAANLVKQQPGKKLLMLPTRDQLHQILAHIRALPIGGPDSANLIAGLAYSGMRIEEAGALKWTSVDLVRGLLHVPGTKTHSAPRTNPLTAAMRQLLDSIPRHHTGEVFRRKECLRSLANACKAVDVPKLTHHDLRHYFATTCIESGVDIPTVSRWLGHADGGALAMQTYGHLRPQHSAEAAAKVIF